MENMLLILIILSFAVANFHLPIPKSYQINKCLEDIALAYFNEKDLILVNFDEIQLNIPYAVLNFNLEITFYFKRIDVYMLEIVTPKDLLNKFVYLSSMKMWNSRAKFIILIQNYDVEIFNILADFIVYNVLIINLADDLSYEITTCFPFDDFDANNLKILSKRIGECSNGTVTNLRGLFVNKLPSIWCNTTIAAQYLLIEPYVMFLDNELSGIEIKIVSMIADIMKFKINFESNRERNWGSTLPNGSYTGAFGDMQANRCELLVGVFPTSDISAKDFDMSFSYLDDSLVWVVPRARLLHTWAKLVRIFDFQSWMLIFLILVVMSFTFYALAYSTLDHRSGWHSFEKSYSVLLASAVSKIPQRFRVRIAFISWCIFCLILKADFDASFISTLLTDSYEKQVETEADMISAKLELGYFFRVREKYRYFNTSKDIYIYQHAENCTLSNVCLDRVAFNRDYATVKPQREMDYLIALRYMTPQGDSLLYVVKDKVSRILSSIYMKKGHPMFPQFNRLLIYAKGSGFVRYWESMLSYIFKLKHNSYVRTSSLVRSHVLGLNQLFSSFVFLFMGLLLALVVFCLELLWYKCSNIRNI